VLVAIKVSAQFLRQFLIVFLDCQIERLPGGFDDVGGTAGVVSGTLR
jgi:hypothetical protein